MTDELLLDVRHLTVEFETDGDRLRAVDDVSFAIRRGEIVGLVGESGAGKSLTSEAILRLIRCPPGWLTGEHPRLAVRVTAHDQAAALCQAAGMAIVSTSANRAGAQPTRNFRDTVRRFKGEVDYILPGRVGDAPAPTPIRDAVTGELVRPG